MEEVNTLNVAGALLAARRSARLSQAELASRSKTSQAAISEIERGRRQPSVELLDRLLRACDHHISVIGPDWLQVDPQDRRHLVDQAKRQPSDRLASLRQLFQLKGLAVPPGDPPARVPTVIERVDMRIVQLEPEALLRGLVDGGVDFVLVGGLAAILRGDIVTTEDADIVPRHALANFQALAHVLAGVKARLMVAINNLELATVDVPITADTFAELTSGRFLTEHGVLDVDVWGPDGASYEHWAQRATPVDLANGTRVVVADLDDLIDSKAEASRPMGRYSLTRLRAVRDVHSQSRRAERQ